MAIQFTNAFREILDTLKEILTNEFKISVHFDKDFEAQASQYFNLSPEVVSTVARSSGSTTREYSVNIRYYLIKGNYEKHSHIDYLTSVAERMSRLFNDKRNAISTNDLFKGVLATFAESENTFDSLIAYTFHDGRIEEVNYQPTLTDKENIENVNVLDFTFQAIVTEVYL